MINWLEKLITEHGSAASLRDHNALLKEQKADFEAKNTICQAALKQCQNAKDILELKVSDLQIQLADAHKQIAALESVRVALKEQTQLELRIRQLEAKNADVEAQLRIKSIGF